MKILRSPAELQSWRKAVNGTVGFVPTMGALHEGHQTLLQHARKENELVVLSLFVNPTQFNDPNDFQNYPITWESDVALAQSEKVDAIFAPQKEDLYPDDYRYRVTETELSHRLCGAHRPGHFDGVLSVVLKLFLLVRPDRAYFGEKDYQQLRLIEGMVKAFFLPLEIIPVPTVRESDGLAMSSRNRRLNPEERKIAPELVHILRTSETTEEARQKLEQRGFRVDYVEDMASRRFAAAFLGETRLIDNIEVPRGRS